MMRIHDGLSSQDKDHYHMHPSEIVFIVFAVAFTLEEYTAQKEHGWTGMCVVPEIIAAGLNCLSVLRKFTWPT